MTQLKGFNCLNSYISCIILIITHLHCIMLFAGKFKEQASSNSAWLPALNSKIPEPRPGTCVDDTSSLPDTVLNFIRSHPLMDKAVNHEHNNPVFYKRDLVFTKLVVDKWVNLFMLSIFLLRWTIAIYPVLYVNAAYTYMYIYRKFSRAFVRWLYGGFLCYPMWLWERACDAA